MRIETFRIIIILISCLSTYISLSQRAINIDYLDLDGNLTTWYDNQIGLENTILYTGSLATPEQKAQISHPFYKSGTWVEERLMYREQNFYNIPLLYDTYNDLLYYKNTTNPIYASLPILPIQNQVSEFLIHDDVFRYINEEVGGLNPGFFHILYEGERVILLAKRAKIIKIGGTAAGESEYRNLDKYYLKIDGKYHQLTRKANILNHFEAHKQEIRRYIRKNRIKVLKAGHDDQLKTLIKYCTQISSK